MDIPKKTQMGDDEDQISKLPDLILGRILSFLTVKEAVQTCVLSTRWINIWKLITNIHLDDRWIKSSTMNDKEYFANVVSKVLDLNSNPTIENFSLLISSDKNYEPHQINKWIASVSEKNIQKLHFKYRAKKVFPSFFPFFSCNDSLVHMVLDMNCSLKVPSTVSFLNLQSLKLYGVVFRELFTDTNYVIFKFPVLKVIKANDCEWFQNLYIYAPQLESVSFMNSVRVSHKSTIKIFALHIEEFYFFGDLLNHNVVIDDPSSVWNCSVQIFLHSDYPMSKMQEVSFQACMFLKQFHEARALSLGPGTAKVLAYSKDLFTEIMPNFSILDHLSMEECTIELLLKFLQKGTFLETLILQSVKPFDEGALNSSTIFPPSLGGVMLLEFKGDEHEIRLAKFILESVEGLEEMIISTNWTWDSNSKLEEIREQVLAYPKRSNIAEVDFIINVRDNIDFETSVYGNNILKEALGLI